MGIARELRTLLREGETFGTRFWFGVGGSGASASEERSVCVRGVVNSTASRFHWTVDFSQPYSNALTVLRLRISNLEGVVLGEENRRGVCAGAFSVSLEWVGLSPVWAECGKGWELAL